MSAIRMVLLRGTAAGLIGTAVMTLAQQLEMSVTGRDPSIVPGQVAAELLPQTEPAPAPGLSISAHWAHGAMMGPLRAGLAATGLSGPRGSAVFFGLMWVGDVLLYRVLGIADWPWRWTRNELATDLGHKALYAIATGVSYDALAKRGSRG